MALVHNEGFHEITLPGETAAGGGVRRDAGRAAQVVDFHPANDRNTLQPYVGDTRASPVQRSGNRNEATAVLGHRRSLVVEVVERHKVACDTVLSSVDVVTVIRRSPQIVSLRLVEHTGAAQLPGCFVPAFPFHWNW